MLTCNPHTRLLAVVKPLETAAILVLALFPSSVLSADGEEDRGLIYGLLVDKEVPIIGASWGGYALGDVPLNGSPVDAEPTLRKAQLNFNKGFGENWSIKLTGNYNNAGQFELSDNYVRYSGWDTAVVQLGVFNAPYSLESVSKTTALTFLERSLPVEALSERKTGGIRWLSRTPKSIFNAQLFLFSPDQEGNEISGQGVVFHYAHAPITMFGHEKVHFGSSFSYRWKTRDDEVRYRTRPEVATTKQYFVDTEVIPNSERGMRFGIELHQALSRSVSWQAELLMSTVDRSDRKNLNFYGGYAFLSWFPTGESRNYDFGSGAFLPVIPNSAVGDGGRGAIELALRASFVDLTDHDVIGGQQANVTLGCNWYLDSRFRVMLNLAKVLDVDRPGSEFDGSDPWIFTARLQWQLAARGRR